MAVVRRRTVLGAALVGAALPLTGCRLPAAGGWTADLPWGRGVALGRPGPLAVGPLSVAVSAPRVVLADSFGGRILVWRRVGAGWRGPDAVPLSTGTPLVAAAAGPPGAPYVAAVASAAGTIWAVPPRGSPVVTAALGSAPGGLRRVLGLAMLADGSVVADVLTLTSTLSARTVELSRAGGGVRVLLRGVVATVRSGGPAAALRWLSPNGIRQGLAPSAQSGVWAAIRGDGAQGAFIARVTEGGRVAHVRPLPKLATPADFLAVDASGTGYALTAAGRPGAALVAFDGAGRVRLRSPLSTGDGPKLPHPAAVASSGALVRLVATPTALQVHWASRLTRRPPAR